MNSPQQRHDVHLRGLDDLVQGDGVVHVVRFTGCIQALIGAILLHIACIMNFAHMRFSTLATVSLLLLARNADAQPEVPLWRVQRAAVAGAGDGPGGLTTVGPVTVGGDGALYVAQPQEHVVKVYDASGRYLRSIGREGAGPGEFDWISGMGWKGDSLWVSDAAQARITVFAPDGTAGRTLGFSHGSAMTEGRVNVPGDLLTDGSVLGFWMAPLHLLVTGPLRVPMVRFSPKGEPLAVLGHLDKRNEFGVLRSDNSQSYFPQPFADAALSAVAPDGSSLVIARREAATSGGSATFHVERILPSGARAFARNYLYRPIPLSREAAEQAVEKLVAGMGAANIRRPSDAALGRAIRQALYRPRYLPPVNEVVMGRDGTIWLRREALGRSHAWWHVLDARGRLVARAWVPANLQVRYADASQLWAVELDALDVPTLVRFRVVRGG
jgi:hypothetical protein